jgi:hypothetical protein
MLLGLAVMVLGGVARGDVLVYDNLTSSVSSPTGSYFGSHYSYAQKFNATTGGGITSIGLNLYRRSTANTGTFTVQLWSGAVSPTTFVTDLKSGVNWSSVGTLDGNPSVSPIEFSSASFSNQATLTQGADYWLVVSSDTLDLNYGWGQGRTATGSGSMYQTLSSPALPVANWQWSNTGISTGFGGYVSVPEPGTLLLGGIAAACGGGGVWWRRNRKAQVAEAVETVTAV